MIQYYKSRYKKTELLHKWQKLLIKGVRSISNSKFKKILDPLDQLQIKLDEKEDNLNSHFLDHSNKEISLRRIEFIEVIELDNIEIAEKQIFKIIHQNKFYPVFGTGKSLPQTRIIEIRDIFKNFKSAFKSWQTGTFFELLNKNPIKNTDLFEYISFSYFKT